MAIHTRIQIDPQATAAVRPGAGDAVEIAIMDDRSDASVVVVLTQDQLSDIVETATQ